ncbi:MAG: alpha/beta hydrolase [Lachnospiraceae bacterium]|nr:alpha/beta hydrolase [Lachnospiraceae bacterium]MDD3615688.1 alpha/beta hydrolase [Lachnospiraceae bacterium]
MKKKIIMGMGLLAGYAGACKGFLDFAIKRHSEKKAARKRKKDEKENGPSYGIYHDRVEEGRQWIKRSISEEWDITSKDGLKLHAYYLENPNPKGIFLLVHGYRASGFGDFACSTKFYYELGYHIVEIDQRSHGKSEGTYIGMGVLERLDVQAWIKVIDKRFEGKLSIYLAGVSMGASTVLMTSTLSLPKSVKGIIADCGFTSPADIFKHVMKLWMNLPPFPFLYGANLLSKWIAGYGFWDVVIPKEMERNQLPILFVHGGEDTFVPTWMGLENYQACRAPKRILIVDGAEHAMSYLVDTKRYQEAVIEFLEGGTK